MNQTFIGALRKACKGQQWALACDDEIVERSSAPSEDGNDRTSVLALPSMASAPGNDSIRMAAATPSAVRSERIQVLPTPRPGKRVWGRPRGPQGHGAVEERLVTWHTPTASAAEQYRKLYTEILRIGRTQTLKMFLVASTLPGEGKTISALNLATVMAAGSSEQGVLIIDTDLRKASVHTCLGAHPVCGLADYLRGDVEYAQIFATTPIPSLTAVYAGNQADNPFALLTSPKMTSFLEQLKADTTYRYVILDTSPVLLTAEPGILAQHVDTTFLVVRAHKTPKELLAQAITALGEENILGLVFNGVSDTDFPYYSYSYETAYYDAVHA